MSVQGSDAPHSGLIFLAPGKYLICLVETTQHPCPRASQFDPASTQSPALVSVGVSVPFNCHLLRADNSS